MASMDLFGSMVVVEQYRASRFDEFWKHYPRRVGKRVAEQAYAKAIKRGATEPELIAGAMRYAAIAREPYIKHPSTWLNGDCWKDEGAPRAPSFMDIVRG